MVCSHTLSGGILFRKCDLVDVQLKDRVGQPLVGIPLELGFAMAHHFGQPPWRYTDVLSLQDPLQLQRLRTALLLGWLPRFLEVGREEAPWRLLDPVLVP